MAAPDVAPATGPAASVRHYEYVLMFHPDKHETADGIADGYARIIATAGGDITRRESWGRRHLAYRINRLHRAAYVMLNFSITAAASRALLDELAGKSDLDSSLLRTLMVRKRAEPEGPSAILVAQEREAAEKREAD